MPLGFFLLLALLVFILWDIFQPVRPKVSKDETTRQVQTGQANWKLLGAAAVGCAVYGVYLWVMPDIGPFGGRLYYQKIMEFATSQWGERGPAVLWLCGGCFLGVVASAAWRKTSSKDS